MSERYVVTTESFVIEADKDASIEQIKEIAYRRLHEEPPRVDRIEPLEV